MKKRKNLIIYMAAVMLIMTACNTQNQSTNEKIIEDTLANETQQSESIQDAEQESTISDVNESETEETESIEESSYQFEPKELINTYTTKFAEVNAVTYPKFMFDYSDNWKIEEESVGSFSEMVILKNERGVEITYSQILMDNPGGYSNILMLGVDVSKVADSAFIPDYVQGTDHSGLGKFMVAKLKVIEMIEMQTDEDFSKVDDGAVAYAVLPESSIGVRHDVRDLTYLIDFAFDYSSKVAFICQAPDGKFTAEEEQEIIEILSSFRVEKLY